RPGTSAGATLQQPRSLERVLDGTGVAAGEVGDDHHVLGEPRRHAEGPGKLPEDGVAVVEVGAYHHMTVVKLTRHQPAVVSPFGESLARTAAGARHVLGEPGQVTDIHEPSIAIASC